MGHKGAMEWFLCDKEIDGLPRLEKSDCPGKKIITFKSSEGEWRMIEKVNKELFLCLLLLTKLNSEVADFKQAKGSARNHGPHCHGMLSWTKA